MYKLDHIKNVNASPHDKNDLIVFVACPFCNTTYSVTIFREDFDAYITGNKLIQDAMPNTSTDNRESVKTGICSPCWDKM